MTNIRAFFRKNSHNTFCKVFASKSLGTSNQDISKAANTVYKTSVKGKLINMKSLEFNNSRENLSSYSKLGRKYNSQLSNYQTNRNHYHHPDFKSKDHIKNKANNSKNKKIYHFSNRDYQGYPKMALNHASVFLDSNEKNKANSYTVRDEIPSENIDERSLSQVRNTIVPRESITSNLKMYASAESPFSNMSGYKANVPKMGRIKYSIVKLQPTFVIGKEGRNSK